MTSVSPPRRMKLLEAAIAVVASNGLHGLSHGAVDTRAALPAGSASYYFRSRKALLEGIVEFIAVGELADIDAAEVSPELADAPLLTQGADLIAGVLAHWLGPTRERTRARLEIMLLAAEQPDLAAGLIDVRDSFLARASRLLTSIGMERPEDGARLVLALVHGLTFDEIASPSAFPLRHDALRSSILAILHAVVGPADTGAGTGPNGPAAAAPEELRPFRIRIPQADLDDLRERLARTRWPVGQSGNDWSDGVSPNCLRDLAEYWRTSYDWRAQEERLNAFPQFITTIDGTDLHFLHARSPEPDALPLILNHGWPGSVAEFTQIIGPLTDPRAYGADPADAFHVVAPSPPGFGFSAPLSDEGWDLRRIAHAFAALMDRLGYRRYGALGYAISHHLGAVDPEHVVGVHVNMFVTPPENAPGTLTDNERERLTHFSEQRTGTRAARSTRSRTLGYALSDSPVGQLAWTLDMFQAGVDPARRPDQVVNRDYLLTDVTLSWLTGTAGSSARLYLEEEHLRPSQSVIARCTGVGQGGHFAAAEQPGPLVDDIRRFFRPLRDGPE